MKMIIAYMRENCPSRLLLLSFPQDSNSQRILIRNVDIFDGKSEKLAEGRDVLIEGNLIKTIGKKLSAADGRVTEMIQRSVQYVGRPELCD
jgi:hypothetical protein